MTSAPALAALAALALTAGRPTKAQPLPASGELELLPDQQVLLEAPGLERVASSAPGQVEIQQVGTDRVQVVNHGPAGAELELWTAGQRRLLRAFTRWPARDSRAGLGRLALTHSEVRLREAGDFLLLDGVLGSAPDVAFAEGLAERQEGLVGLWRVDPQVVEAELAALAGELPAGLRAEWAGDRVVLRGTAEQAALLEASAKAEARLGALGRAVKAGRAWIEPAPAAPGPTLTLWAGSQKIIELPEGSLVGVGDPAVIETKWISPKHLLVVSHERGKTRLLIRHAGSKDLEYAVTVRDGNEDLVICDLCKLMGRPYSERMDRNGLRQRSSGDRVFIEGRAHTVEEILRLQVVKRRYPNVPVFAHADPGLVERQRLRFELELARHRVRGLRLVRTGSSFVVEGRPASSADAEVAQGLLEALLSPLEPFLGEPAPQ